MKVMTNVISVLKVVMLSGFGLLFPEGIATSTVKITDC